LVVWIIGLSGAGKTTLANQVIAEARQKINNVILIDGDMVREVFGNDLGYTMEDRRKNADRISQLCQLLDNQGIHVVCAILSIFPESREWNRKYIRDYFEVFIDTPMPDLISRDSKGIYGQINYGMASNVVGVDIEFPYPKNADLIIKNTGKVEDLLQFSKTIADQIMGS
jgi:adenylylsulfate kinase